MSLRRPLLLTMALLVAACAVVRADDFVYARFGEYLDALRTQAGIPGLAVAVVGPDDVLWERLFGQQDVERNIVTRADTPFQLDGTTQAIVGSLAVRCAADGWLSLDDLVGKYAPTSPDAGATIRQLLTHTYTSANGLSFAYRPERLAPVAAAISGCTDSTFRWGVSNFVERFSMMDSVPGADVAQLTAPAENFTASELQRYRDVLRRLATPYSVSGDNRATATTYVAQTLTPASGLIATLIDVEKFDLALKHGNVVRAEALAYEWTPPTDAGGRPLPHAYGWFVQNYGGEKIVWQFGVSDNASSSMIVTLPRRGLTLIMLANSQGLARPFPLAGGDATVSPFVRLFLSIFAR